MKEKKEIVPFPLLFYLLAARRAMNQLPMTARLILLMMLGIFATSVVSAQTPVKQTDIDTSLIDYDVLFDDFEAILDSMTAPRSFLLFNMATANNYYSYQSKSTFYLENRTKTTWTPSLGYFSKKGWGVSGTSVVIDDGEHLNPFQFYLTGSYDYLEKRNWVSGIAFTRFFTKDSLPFYTSPLKNEIYAYFTYRKPWIKPSVAVSYGWGKRSDLEEREEYITSLRLVLNGFTRVDTRESINDLNIMTAVRHDFFWMNVMGKDDYVRITPQVVFTSGTQRFGFNQTISTYASLPRTGVNILSNSDNIYLDDKLYFQPLALTAYMKAEYSKGKFYIQPQLLFDYYFPATENKFNTIFVLNAGVIF
jgi:hypothetical protein